MNRLNELADFLDRGTLTTGDRDYLAALLRSAATRPVGTEWGAGYTEAQRRAAAAHNPEIDAARIAVAEAEAQRDAARTEACIAVESVRAERNDAITKLAAIENAIRFRSDATAKAVGDIIGNSSGTVTGSPHPLDEQQPATTAAKEFAQVINRRSLESVSNTPDWVLGDFLDSCRIAFDTAVNARAGTQPAPPDGRVEEALSGRTLRDWFAGQALAVMNASPIYSTGPGNVAVAERAYAIADAIRLHSPGVLPESLVVISPSIGGQAVIAIRHGEVEEADGSTTYTLTIPPDEIAEAVLRDAMVRDATLSRWPGGDWVGNHRSFNDDAHGGSLGAAFAAWKFAKGIA